MKIITHGAQAHPDEIMATALILLKHNISPNDAQILRVDELNLDDPAPHADADYIVDVGRKHDPERHWFDHHQFPKDAAPECAFTLLWKHFGYARNDLSWIDQFATLDSKGPFYWFEKKFGRPAKNMKEISGVLGTIDVFSWFAHVANTSYKNPNAFKDALNLAIPWLRSELDYMTSRRENVAFARANLTIVDMKSFKVAYFAQKEMRGTTEVCNEIVEADPLVIITAKLDDRGPGYSALRLNNCPRVDFLPRKGEPDCIFAHESGFCLKWKKDWTTFLSALQRSVAG